MCHKLIPALIAAAAMAVCAQMLRIDMGANAPLDFENGPGISIRHCEWLPQPEHCLTFNKETTGQWREITFTVIPRQDAVMELILMTARPGEQVLVDDVKINGVGVENGSFEETGAHGPARWWCEDKYHGGIVTSADASDGRLCARLFSNARLFRKIRLDSGRRYLFSLKAKTPGRLEDIPVDLDGFLNRAYADEVAGDNAGGWTDQGPEQDLRNFPAESRYDGVSFRLAPPGSRNAVAVFDSSHCPTGLAQLRRDFGAPYPSGRYLYVLHTAAWGDLPEGEAGATVSVTLDTGEVITRDFTGKREIADWTSTLSLPNGKIVWQGRQAGGSAAVLYLSAVPLGNVGGKVKSVQFSSTGRCIWILLGASISWQEVDFSLPVDRRFTADAEWKAIDLSDLWIREKSALDFSQLVPDLPAGHYGRPMIGPNGTLVFEDAPEVPVRFLGNFGGVVAVFQLRNSDLPWEQRRRMIDDFARQHRMHGYNLFRMGALMDLGTFHSNTEYMKIVPMSEEQIDFLDYLAYAMKKNGVYLYLDLGCDGLRWNNAPPIPQVKAGALLGEQECLEHWKDNAEAILNHVNPYTGIAWKDDPMVLCTHQFNEQATNAIIQIEHAGQLPERIRQALLDRWCQWMRDHYGSPSALAGWGLGSEVRGDFSNLGIPSFQSGKLGAEFSRFFMAACTAHEAWCNEIIRGTGSRALVSAYNSCITMGAMAARWQHSEVISNNMHIGHPVGYESSPTPSVPQTSSIRESTEGSAFCYSNRARALDRPMILSEYSQAFWNRTRYECGLLTPAYAALNGYSGIVWFAYGVSQKSQANYQRGLDAFEMTRSPICRASAALSFFLFRRGDVKMAPHSIELAIPNRYLDENASRATSSIQSRISLITRYGTAFTELPSHPGVPGFEPTMRIEPDATSRVNSGQLFSTAGQSVGGKFSLAEFVQELKERQILPPDNLTDPDNGVYQSETGEITAYGQEEVMTVTTPNTEAAAGPGGVRRELGRLAFTSSVPSTVSASSLDGLPLGESRHILMLFITREANSGMLVSGDERIMRNFGGNPILLETGQADISLEHDGQLQWRCHALALNGERREEIPVVIRDGRIEVAINTATLSHGPTPFFELIARPPESR